jgi:Ca2+-binding EF-hand superfamily protein
MKNIILITMLMSAVFAQSDCNKINWKESYQGDDMTDCEKSSYKLFNTIDRNKNGKIGKKEFFRFYKRLKETEQLRILATYQLQLTVHLMRDIEMNLQGVAMTTDHITSSVIQDEIMPELNRI